MNQWGDLHPSIINADMSSLSNTPAGVTKSRVLCASMSPEENVIPSEAVSIYQVCWINKLKLVRTAREYFLRGVAAGIDYHARMSIFL